MKFSFFLREVAKRKSLSRIMLYSAMADLFSRERWLNDSHTVLEIGSEPAMHQRTYPKNWRLTESNYVRVSNGKTDLIIDASKKFPLRSGAFDGSIMIGVLYLIDNYVECLHELVRVSKKFAIFNITLISGIARQPNDFNRFTEDRLIKIMEQMKNDLPIKKYVIIPVGGSFSSAVHLINPFLRITFFNFFIYSLALLLDKLDRRLKRSCPLQYLVYIVLKDVKE